MPDSGEVYVTATKVRLRKKPKLSEKGATTTVLMGTFLKVLEDNGAGWLRVTAFGEEGWVPQDETAATTNALKFFFVDVGQGDGVLIEGPKGRLIVDGGQFSEFRNYLTKWKYKHLIAAGFDVRIDGIVVSHFDADHFKGLTAIVDNPSFTIGTIFHAGIARFSRTASERPAGFDTELGRTKNNRTALVTKFDDLDDAAALLAGGGLQASFRMFLEAAVAAHADGRLDAMKAVGAAASSGAARPLGVDLGTGIGIRVLGPIANTDGSFPYWDDDSHTVNGHSVVLRIDYDTRSFLLGGDLNIPSEGHLLARANDPDLFHVDVAKACHHGSSEFTVDFLEVVNPFATVFSSGDDENYGHPQPDALGATGKHSRGVRPLIFSTELARSTSADDIHYGLINVRTDGEGAILAQMFDNPPSGADIWNSFTLQ